MAFTCQAVIFLIIVVHTPEIDSALCDITGPTLIGSVFEYAPSGTFVLEANFTGEVGIDITLTLDPTLDPFFTMSGKNMTVKDNTNITRNDGSGGVISGGKIVCDLIVPPTSQIVKSVFVTIDNINTISTLKFGSDSYAETILETAMVGDMVATVTATDDDVTSIDYSITDQNPPGFFKLQSPSSGNILLDKTLDYEDNQQHTLKISATSLGFDNLGNEYGEVASTSVVIDVIDVDNNAPQFQPCFNALVTYVCVEPLYTTMVYEDENQTQYIHPQEINAIDLDSGINSSIIYSFVTGIPEHYDEYFAINSSTGYVEVIQSINESFTISVMATEDTGKSSLTYLLISMNETIAEPCNNCDISPELFYGIIGGLSGLCLIFCLISIACCVFQCRTNPNPDLKAERSLSSVQMVGMASNPEPEAQTSSNMGKDNDVYEDLDVKPSHQESIHIKRTPTRPPKPTERNFQTSPSMGQVDDVGIYEDVEVEIVPPGQQHLQEGEYCTTLQRRENGFESNTNTEYLRPMDVRDSHNFVNHSRHNRTGNNNTFNSDESPPAPLPRDRTRRKLKR